MCRKPCGLLDSLVGTRKPENGVDHHCFLPLNHPGRCVFLDRCGKMQGPRYDY